MNKPIAATIDPAGTKLVCQFEHEIPLMSCVIDPTGRWCFSGGRGRKIYVTDINTGLTEARDDHEVAVVDLEVATLELLVVMRDLELA